MPLSSLFYNFPTFFVKSYTVFFSIYMVFIDQTHPSHNVNWRRSEVVSYLAVAFLVLSPHIKGALHQQLPEFTQVSLWTSTKTVRAISIGSLFMLSCLSSITTYRVEFRGNCLYIFQASAVSRLLTILTLTNVSWFSLFLVTRYNNWFHRLKVAKFTAMSLISAFEVLGFILNYYNNYYIVPW